MTVRGSKADSMRNRSPVKSQTDYVDVYTAKVAISPGLTGTLLTSTNMGTVVSGTGPVGAAPGQPAQTGYTVLFTIPDEDRYPSFLSWDFSLECNPAYAHLYKGVKLSHSAVNGTFKGIVAVASGTNVLNVGYGTDVVGAAAVTGTLTAYFRNRTD